MRLRHESPELRQVPQDALLRSRLRLRAIDIAARLDRSVPPALESLMELARTWLEGEGLPPDYLGFAVIALNNAFWMGAFASTPYSRRILLLPHCLAHPHDCRAAGDAEGLHCADCGRCEITALRADAAALGCQVIVAEGVGQLLDRLTSNQADALLGVACMESLAKSFSRIAELGVAHLAVPLLQDGCRSTQTDFDYVREVLSTPPTQGRPQARSFLPLLRQTRLVFESPLFDSLLADALPAAGTESRLLLETDRIALDYLRHGGKRLRPFTVLAACAVARGGETALMGHADLAPLVGPAEQRVAIAIESLHKASLVHDDIEDDDAFRYGKPTLHRQHGIPAAVNIGDHLVGLGYRLIASQAPRLGADAAADMLAALSRAHVELCRGQGAELFALANPQDLLLPADAMRLYALKTSPAFEAALFCGLRLSGAAFDAERLRTFCTFLGVAFQIANDLDDWKSDEGNKKLPGRDALAGRPTLLRALASAAGGAEDLAAMETRRQQLPAAEWVAECHSFYTQHRVFERGEDLLRRMERSAAEAAGKVSSESVAYLLRSLLRLALPQGRLAP
jgi:geranylgeranyl pyrophosphate synthase